MSKQQHEQTEGIAIIGLAGRFPQAKTLDEFWQNIRQGVESVVAFTDEELLAAGIKPATLADPSYVKAKALLDDVELFDAPFFGINPKEAAVMDPQQRLFLEYAWTALEHAGYDSEQHKGPIGLFAGVGLNSYLVINLLSHPNFVDATGILQASIPNRTDHLATRAAYKLNLKGSAVTVQTACSTSLVAVHLACQSLTNYECDMALAGGVTVSVPNKAGYHHQEGGVLSADGHCRAFDHRANGTVVGNGVGVVLLKRLADALADGDEIHAVIRGSAINNDGALKVGYTAPSVEGQVEVIAMAQAVAGVEPDSITYIEAHGTGTTLGDPIEIAALTQAFRAHTQKKNFCAVGSVKANIGHLDVAAGVAGLIKTTLALKHRTLPPLVNFERPNPQIDFASSPFYVNTEARPWPRDAAPRRAGLSSFGIGGTNAHVIVEEAPEPSPSGPARASQLLVLSAKTATALEAATTNLSAFLRANPQVNLADVAYTLQRGRRAFEHRRILVCRDAQDAVESLTSLDPRRVFAGLQEPRDRPVMFMFPGQGAQYVGMGRELYEQEPAFREAVDRCAELLKPHLDADVRDLLYPQHDAAQQSEERLKQTSITQPALFVVEYALSKLLAEWGIRPQAMIGHSIGEYVAAHLAGVFSLEDALALVAARGRLMQSAPRGEMLSVSLPAREAEALLGEGVSLAAVNSPSLCVVAGTPEAIAELEQRLTERDVMCRRLHTSHAFHSHMMDSALAPFRAELGKVKLNAPVLPFISNLTGTWITAAQATDPEYWVKHLRQTVRFGEGVARLFEEPDAVLLEVGPGKTLMTIARWHPAKGAGQMVLTSLPQPDERGGDLAFVLNSLGRLWLTGVGVDWAGLSARAQRRRVPLPTYPFERQRYWIEAQEQQKELHTATASLSKKPDVADWFYFPVWKSSVPAHRTRKADGLWLLFADECGVGADLASRLERQGAQVVTVTVGERFEERDERRFIVNPRSRQDYEELLRSVSARGGQPAHIVHLWNVTPEVDSLGDAGFAERCQSLGFYSLLALAQALGQQLESNALRLSVVTNNLHRVTGRESLCPDKATVMGPCRVVPQEYAHISCRNVDVELPSRDGEREALLALLVDELKSEATEKVVAFRGRRRWTQSFERQRVERPEMAADALRQKGVYLITGGLGGVGLVLADQLARTAQARLVLVGRTPFPARERWRRWLATQDEADEVSRKIRQIQELEKHGARVEVMNADVADREQMRRVVESVRERWGAVNGVVHAAGVAGGGMIQLKTEEKAASILAPKVAGTKVLGELFAGEALDFMLLCSSRSSILGGFGQIDYCAANAFLDAFAHYYTERTGTRTISVDWDGWQDVGMLVNTAAQYGVGGAAQFHARESGHPLLGKLVSATDEREVYVNEVSVAGDWILEEHRIGGIAVLPGVTYLEMARAAFEPHARGAAIELRDIFFVTPMGIHDDERREVRLVLEKNGAGYKFYASSRSLHDAEGQWQDHALGEVGAAPAPEVRRHDLKQLIERCSERVLLADEHEQDPDLGPRWQNIKKAYVRDGECLVLFELDEEFTADFEKLKLHPSLLDRAAGSGMLYMELDGVYLPMAYKRLTFTQPLPRRVYAHIKQTENNYSKKETITFDVSIMDETGTELVWIEEFSEKRINDLTEQVKQMAEKKANRAVSLTPESEAPPVAPEKSFYQESISEGIAPAEGADAFMRILADPFATAQVVVSTKDLEASAARADAFVRERVSEEIEKLQVARPQHARPNLQTAYVEPRNEAEHALAEIMQEALGIDRVGVNDNFFELGGDSVLSIQIIARANRAGWQITPQQMFQHQTIAELAVVASNAAAAGAEARPLATAPAPAAAQNPPRPAFELANLDERKLDKLSQLLADDDDEDEDDEESGDLKPAAVAASTGVVPASAAPSPVGEVESVLRQHPSVREAVVVAREGNGAGPQLVAYVVMDGADAARHRSAGMDFSLFYFAADNSQSGEDKYRLYLEGARFADQHGFNAIWTPERHFHESGGLYPNPSVLSAALATITERVKLRAGSVVMPLHHSIRVAEEWSVIDNLSRGRVGLSFTAGWIPNDFAFFPERYPNKREEMLRGIEEVCRLWRGQSVTAHDGAGRDFEVKVLPRPIQPELPVWLTCSGDPQMFVTAGELGHNVLTALLSQSVEEVAGKIKLYRDARARAGHDPRTGQVALMVHTFVGEDERDVVATARAPLSDYLRSHVGLIETMTKSLDIKVDIDKEQYLDYLIEFAFERYYQTASLIGTPDKCLRMIERLREIGVDEVACFVDFGIDAERVLGGLRHLNTLRELSAESAGPDADGGGAHAQESVRVLSEFVQDRLPAHTSRTSFVVLDTLPLTPGGSIDYRALPSPEGSTLSRT